MALKELALNWLMQQDKQRLANELKSNSLSVKDS